MSVRTEMRIARILAMIPFVVARDGASIQDLRERFGYASDAEVVKDLQLIFLTGLPGYGPGDLIDVDIFEDEVTIDSADYFARPMRLTPTEALGLLAAGSTFIASDQASPELRSAIEKLSRAIGAQTDDHVLVDVPTPPTVELLRSAIEETKLVEITYVAITTNEHTTRVVEGESVFFNLGRWYFSGFCRYADADRLFRVDRIDTVQVLDELYEPSVADASSIVRYEPSPDDHVVEFTVGTASRWVTEYYPVEASPLPDGRQHVTMRVSDPLVAARLLLRLGSDAVLVSGDTVAAALEDLRGRVLLRYA
jgi:proteasome accessory factor C